MNFEETTVFNASKVTCDRHVDLRGFFQEIYNVKNWDKKDWLQMNWSKSDKHVLRGIHVAPYDKLITCVAGRIFDVCVDLRYGSPTFLKCYTTILDERIPQQVFIPENCGHAFLSLEWDSSVVYMQTGCHDPETEWTIAWNDPELAIQWPVLESEIILSDKDRIAMTLRELNKNKIGKLNL